jgi:hypothetical protein
MFHDGARSCLAEDGYDSDRSRLCSCCLLLFTGTHCYPRALLDVGLRRWAPPTEAWANELRRLHYERYHRRVAMEQEAHARAVRAAQERAAMAAAAHAAQVAHQAAALPAFCHA